MKRIAVLLIMLAAAFFSGFASAQEQTAQVGTINPTPAQRELPGPNSVEKLPVKMTGTWLFKPASFSGREATDGWSVTIEKQPDQLGPIQGKLTFVGQRCQAREAQMTGQRVAADRAVFEAVIGSCGKGTFTLQKEGGVWKGDANIQYAPGHGTTEVTLGPS